MAEAKSLYVILSANATNYRQALNAAARETREFGREVDDVAVRIDRADSEIDKMSGRLRLMLDVLKLVGPGAAPIAAVAVPAVTGLANSLGFAAVAGGSAMLAFQGVGTALEALNKAQLEPTQQNLAAARQELEDLHPAAAEFVVELDRMASQWDTVQEAAAAGLFPGLTEGLTDLTDVIPQLRGLTGEIADATGDILADAGEDLSSDRAREFYAFLEREARPTLISLYETTGNLAGGLSALWQSFEPLNSDVSNWLVSSTERFDEWARGLDQTEGFEEFMEYVRANGPRVRDFFVETADAILEIGEAAAPLGGPVLDTLTATAEAIGAIADSPVGTPIVAAVAATTLLNRGLAVTAGLMTRAGLGAGGGAVAATGSGVIGAISSQAGRAQSSIRGLSGDLRAMSREYERVGRGQSVLLSGLSNTTAAAQRTRTALSGIAKGGAVLGGVGLIATGTADRIEATNTATLALTGAMVGGPYGAIAGGIVGAFADASASSVDYASSLSRLEKVSRSTASSFEDLVDAGGKALSDLAAKQADMGNVTGVGDAIELSKAGWGIAFDTLTGQTNDASKWRDSVKATKQEWSNLTGVLSAVARAQGDVVRAGSTIDAEKLGLPEEFAPGGAAVGWIGNLEDMGRVAASIQPAMRELGYTWDDLFSADAGDKAVIVNDLNRQLAYMDSNVGQIDAVADALADLDNGLLSTAQSATALDQALTSMLDPKVNVSEQLDAWVISLRTLNEDLNGNSRTLRGNSDAALQNRAAIRERVTQLKDTLTAQAEAGAGSEELARSLHRQREALVRTALAAGVGRKELRGYLRELGLTPKLVRTTLEAAGVDVEAEKVRTLRRALAALPEKLQTKIATEGVPRTKAEVDALVEKYKLTEKERKALVTLIDHASPKARTIKQVIDSIRDKAVTITTTHVDIYNRRRGSTGGGQGQKDVPQADGGLWSGGVRRFADGGFGADGRYYPRVSQMVNGGANILWGEQETGWEAYISGKPSMRDRNVRILGEAARRLGVDMAPRRGSEYATRTGSAPVVIQQAGGGFPDRVQLVVGGRSFTAYVRAEAADVAAETAGAARDFDDSHGRMSWT